MSSEAETDPDTGLGRRVLEMIEQGFGGHYDVSTRLKAMKFNGMGDRDVGRTLRFCLSTMATTPPEALARGR